MTLKEQYFLDLKRVKMTSTQVANKLGISRQSLYKSLDRKMSFERACEIWAAMGCEMGKCFKDEDGKTRVKKFFD